MSDSTEPTNDSGPTFKITISGDGVTVEKEVGADVATQLMMLVMGGSAPAVVSGGGGAGSGGGRTARRQRRAATNAGAPGGGSGSKPAKRKPSSVGIVRDLALRPPGKQPWIEFAEEKAPKTNGARSTVAVHWLVNVAGMSSGITVDHVNTCFVEAGWKRPADFVNALQVVSSTKGWLDTGDMGNIKLTLRGEDEVQHNLPPQSKQK
jgi:hypothetical protein